MSQDFFSGKGASFGLNGTNYTGNDGWSAEDAPTENRTDNTADAGFSNRIISGKNLEITLEQSWDASANPFDTPINLYPGAVLTNAKFYLNGTSSPFYLLPSAIVLSASVPAKVGDVVKCNVKIANKGTFTRPTGNFTAATP
jgi:hypothetical protein